MSYILDALRRADAERERGAVPGLHAQTLSVEAPAGGGARRPELWWAAAGAVMLAAAVAVAGWVLSRERASGAVVPAGMPAAAVGQGAGPAVAQEAAQKAAQAAPAAVAPTAPPPAASSVAAAPPPSPPADRLRAERPAPRPVRPQRQPAAAAAGDTAVEPPAARDTARDTASRKPARETSPDPERRIFALDELPPEVRRELPALSVSGSIYSDDAASRFVMINGEAVREGGRIAPDLTLERIQLKSAVLRFKGYRYRIPL